MIIANDSGNHGGLLIAKIPTSLIEERSDFLNACNGFYVNNSNYATVMVKITSTGIAEISFIQAGQNYSSIEIYGK